MYRRPKETYISIIAAAGIAAYPLLPSDIRVYALWLVLISGGLPLVWDLIGRMRMREFGSDILAGISILSATLLGEYLVGAIVVLMLAGGATLESYAARRAASALDALARRMPRAAHRRENHSLREIAVEKIRIGDTLVVFPHEICPVDGEVSEGHGRMDESYLTGEPYEMSKTPGCEVISGAMNGDSALTIRATRLTADSRYASIMRVMRETEQRRPKIRRIGDRLGAWYTLLALAVGLAGWYLGGDAKRFLAVMVIATPCPLLIGIPVAIIGAISLSAGRGIIVRNPGALEEIDSCRTMILDKTGTLTYGRPSLTEVLVAPPLDKNEVLRLAASLERYSKHPLGVAIMEAAAGMHLEEASHISEPPGEGLTGTVAARQVRITGRAKVDAAGLPPQVSGLECVVMIDSQYAATFRFHDQPRPDSAGFISHLRPKHLMTRVLLVSGDRESEVRYLAGVVGIREVYASQSPEQKVAIVREASRTAKTLFVGDGINDAPAMVAATVGVAIGRGSDVTVDAADMVLLDPSLRKVDELIHIGRHMRLIAMQSAVGGMALSMAGMIAAAAGLLPPLAGAVAQEVIDLAAILNALRAAIPPSQISDLDQDPGSRK
ncbi:MAG: heavy metal translocating P-type ATPase [Bryobacteraceae bacterium]|nr:heavy metal translocating P-type ATPase [Bryobacteraceae bacterium]